MKDILPEFGIQFCEVPRICQSDSVVSASRVRALLKDKNWQEVEKLVPLSTLEYLKNSILK